MLERMRRKGNPSTLLVQMQTGVATVENSMEFPQKTKNGTALWPSNSAADIIPWNPDTPIQKNLCTPMFTAAQFIIANYWKQPKCSSANKWIQTLWYSYTMELRSREKEGAYTLCNSMGGTGEHYAEWTKPGGEGQIPYDLTFNWNIINRRKKETKYN